jgi:hypothetical protein
MLGLVMVSLVFVYGGWAGPKHYVASYGLDSNPCTLDSPCRSFSHAVDMTDAGGEVIVLDTGGYGSVTITKSISIIAPVGMYASVTVASGTNGITINAGASDKVLIKGLTIKGTSGTLDGILANTVGTLIVDNCFISGLERHGIHSQAPDSELAILDSKINNSATGSAVFIYNSSGSVSVSMNNVEMVKNGSGGLYIYAYGTGSIFATVTNSLANHNYYGFFNGDVSSGTSVLNLEHCIASGNEYGIYSHNDSATDVTRLSNCTVTGNTYGVYRIPSSPGTIFTRENNTVIGNTTNSNVTPNIFSAW